MPQTRFLVIPVAPSRVCMRIAEIYRSKQGEGRLTGTDSAFVRTSGCNLRCHYCDSPHTSWKPEGRDLALSEIWRMVAELDARHVVLTGGEPLLFTETLPLAAGLKELGYHITAETAGTIYLPIACDLMSISPKMSNSAPDRDAHPQWHRRHEATRVAADVVRRLTREYDYQIKFVITDPQDLPEVDRFLEQQPQIPDASVYLMPEGTTTARLESIANWLIPYCQKSGRAYCPRRHIEWFGHVRGT